MVKIYRRRIQIAPVGFEVDRVVIPAIEEKAEKVYLMVHKDRSKDKATKYAAAIQGNSRLQRLKQNLFTATGKTLKRLQGWQEI